MKEYKISVKLNTWDMYCFLMRHEYGSFSGLFGLAVSLLALVALIAGMGKDDRNTQILLGLVAACFTVLNPLRLLFRAQKQLTLNPTFHKPIDYTFAEAGMHIAQGEEQMDVAWPDMKKLVRGRRIMILYLSKVVGYIFPKSQCNGQYEEIAAMIQLKMAQAQAEQASIGAERETGFEAETEETGEADAKKQEADRKKREAAAKASLARQMEAAESNDPTEPDFSGKEVSGSEASGQNSSKQKTLGQKDSEEVPEETLEEILHAARKRSGKKKTARNYDMPPGEAEIWGEDEP